VDKGVSWKGRLMLEACLRLGCREYSTTFFVIDKSRILYGDLGTEAQLQ